MIDDFFYESQSVSPPGQTVDGARRVGLKLARPPHRQPRDRAWYDAGQAREL